MSIWSWIGGIVAIVFLVFVLALCKAAGDADERMGYK